MGILSMKDRHDKTMQYQIRKILQQRCKLNEVPSNSQQPIYLDSMALLELIVGLENEFKIKLVNDKLQDFYQSYSVDSLCQLVESELANNGQRK